nr:hypothetical protein [Candidatus Sigynarchaeota archaeon]
MNMPNEDESKKIAESRKLVKWGSSETLIMSLPRNWVKKFGLTKDSEVTIIENQDGSLLVSPLSLGNEKPRFESTITFDIAELEDDDLIELEITTKYLDGNDIINIEKKGDKYKTEKFSTRFTLKVQEVVQSLLGLEITTFLSTKIKIVDIMSVQEANVDVLVKIISDTTIDFFQNLIELLHKPDIPAHVDSFSISKKQVRKYYLRILRELRKGLLVPTSLSKMGLTAQDTVDLAFFITDVSETSEKLDFVLTTLNNHCENCTTETNKEMLDKLAVFMGEVSDIFKKAVDAFLFSVKKDAFSVIKMVPTLEDRKRQFENEMDAYPDSNKYVHFQIILDVMSKILDHCNSISLTSLRRIA